MTDSELWGLTVYEMLHRIAKAYGSKMLFSYLEEENVKEVSHQQFFRDICVTAEHFAALGLKGKRVVIDSRNTYEQVVSLFAAVSMGAVAVPLNFDLSEEDLLDAAKRVEPAMVVYDPEDEALAGRMGLEESCLLASHGNGASESVRKWLDRDGEPGWSGYGGSPDSPALILLTSGSTSRSKLVVLNHYAFFPHAGMETEKSIFLLPMSHIAGLNILMNDMVRGTLICLSNMKNGMADIRWFRPKDIFTVPMFVTMMIKQHKKNRLDLSSVKNISSCGAPQNLEAAEYLLSLGIFSASFYGSTEVSGIVAYSTPREYRFGSVGRPGPWNQIRISKSGEILIRGKTVMLGYLGDEQASGEALEEGWYHTGDIGYLDEDGYLFLTGRMKNIIILSNGENVSPEALEERLYRCALIEEVVVYGEDDKIAASVWCGKGTGEREQEEIREYIFRFNQTMPRFHNIRKVVFRDKPFEKTGSGKIKRASAWE